MSLLQAGVILLRFVQYLGAAVLFGSSLFFLFGLPKAGEYAASNRKLPRQLIIISAAAVLFSSILGLIAQTGIVAGSLSEGLKLSSLETVIVDMNFGRSSVVRAGLAALLLFMSGVLRPGYRMWVVSAAGGILISASFAWMGHAAATEGGGGDLHLASDIIHALAASAWIGSLIVFFVLLFLSGQTPASQRILLNALNGFSGIGSTLVAILIVTGIVNSWFLVGPNGLNGLWSTPYGQLLLTKVALFLGMLGLATLNRFRLAPALASRLGQDYSKPDALAGLRRSIALESGIAFVVLSLVGWLGTLAPISAQ
ncbi:MAG: copper homeostasis membrane protein CopD [Pseudomonadota bacterium]